MERAGTSGSGAASAGGASVRQAYVDVFRGLLIVHMGLDHTSLFFNAGRGEEELARVAPLPPADILQFLTRLSGVPVAPGFFFMAGFMLAWTSVARERRGTSARDVTRRLIARGLVLLAVDALVLGLPRALSGFYSFMVLSSIGVSVILLALIRHWPTRVLLPAALLVLALHPLLDVSGAPLAIRAIAYEPVRTGALRSLYPVIPWAAIALLGFIVGRDAIERPRPCRLWLMLSGLCLGLFALVRATGYGNAYAFTRVTSLDFWFFAKYPPDLPFLTWALAWIFLWLAVLRAWTRSDTPVLLRPLAVFGRVPFFFYVVHFYVLGLAALLLELKTGLLGTYVLWLCLLGAMAWPCSWYHAKKRDQPNLLTRYL